MKFSYSLLKTLVPKLPSAKKLSEELSLHSFEVESVAGDTLDIKVPANIYSGRSHHYGIAEEIAAIFDIKTKSLYPRTVNIPEKKGLLKIDIQEFGLCRRYAGRVFEIKKVGQSDAATKKYLKSCGINPINAVVDAMNLAMLLTGQPLHCFDYDRLSNDNRAVKIVVRKSKKGESIPALDNKTYELPTGTLVIADEKEPLAIAGIKGGSSSGVTSKTKRILVEAANFKGAGIYRSVRAIGLSTDASMRFSHDLSPELVDLGMDCASLLLKKLGAKMLDSVDVGKKRTKPLQLTLALSSYRKLMGESVPGPEAIRILNALGFFSRLTAHKGEGVLVVDVPLWRDDVSQPEDIIEEIARIRGYQAILPKPPSVQLTTHSLGERWEFAARIRNSLVQYKLDEAVLSAFVSSEAVKAVGGTQFVFGKDSELLSVANPISGDRSIMRPSLLSNLADAVRSNTRFFEEVRQFEVGQIFADKGGVPLEKQSVAMVIARKGDSKVFLEVKGIVEGFMKDIGVYDFVLVPRADELYIECGKLIVGRVIHLPAPRGFSMAGAEFDGEELRQLVSEEKEYREIPRFPGTWRDASLLLSSEISIGEVMKAAQLDGPAWLEDVDLMDEFSDENKLGVGKRSITLRFRFQAKDRTLSDEEVTAAMNKTLDALKTEFKAEVR
jgi:phenylalanyl-tRNA synthetase beta chain